MILVTGGAGYIGSVLVRELLALGETVRVVDPYWFGDYLPTNERLEVVREDLRYCDTAAVLKDVDAVIHLSGLSNDPTADFAPDLDRKSTRLNSSHANISYAVFCLKKKKLLLTYI